MDDIGGPNLRYGNPIRFRQEKGAGQDDTTNARIVFYIIGLAAMGAVFQDLIPEGQKVGGAVFLFEGIPGEGEREKGMPDKKAAAHDKIMGAVQFKEKREVRFDGGKSLAPARLPEVDLVGLEVGEVGEPVVVGDGDVEFHESLFSLFS